MERMQWLVNELNKHCYNYYVLDNPTISDFDFDKLYDELVMLEKETGIILEDSPTRRVGDVVLDGFTKKTHKYKMYSLNKSKTYKEIESFVNDIKSIEPNSNFTIGYKFDGLTIVCEYNNGLFISATTRGNGTIGEDVTEQVRTIKSLPLKIKFKDNLIVSGEGMISNKNLEIYNTTSNEPLKNARNAVSGAIRNLNPKETAKRRLDFYCYNVLYAEGVNFTTQEEMNQFIKDNNFLCEPYVKVVSTADEIWQEIQKIDKIKENLGILIDGMVIKLNQIEKRDEFGYTSKFPKWALAFKFEAQEVTSILKNVVWQVGRTGKVTPIAEIEPVELAGATVKRATLNNYGDIVRKKVQINSRVFVRRSNEVIPEILGLAELLPNSKPIKKIQYCPCCKSKLKEIGALLFCTNRTGCSEQVVDRLTHFASRNAMNIEGLRDKICELFYEKFNIALPSDLYSLTKEQLLSLENFKEKKADNVLNSLAKSKNVNFSNFIYALGINGVGEKTAKDLAKYFGSLEALKKAKQDEFLIIKDIGEVIAKNIYEFFNDDFNLDMIDKLINVGLIIKQENSVVSAKFQGKTFVLTGTLANLTRSEATKLIEQNGGQTSSSVSKNTSFVLAGESAGSKLDKAISLGINIINEEEFINLINSI